SRRWRWGLCSRTRARSRRKILPASSLSESLPVKQWRMRLLQIGELEPDALGAKLLARERTQAEPQVTLGPRERALFADMHAWPLRRSEWLAGRAVAKELLQRGFGLEPARVEVLPAPSE